MAPGTRKLRVFCFGDIHAPFQDARAIEAAYTKLDLFEPDVILQMGDLNDRFSFGRFARSHDEMTPAEEIDEARQFGIGFWAQVHKLAPRARKIQLLGNHCVRILRQTMERYPEVYSILQRADGDLYRFKNVETMMDVRGELEIEGVLYTHGWSTGMGYHARYFGQPVVRAHSHRGSVWFANQRGRELWELDCGFLADERRRALQYTPTMTTLWTLGVGEIDSDGPRFVPIYLPKEKKNGK